MYFFYSPAKREELKKEPLSKKVRKNVYTTFLLSTLPQFIDNEWLMDEHLVTENAKKIMIELRDGSLKLKFTTTKAHQSHKFLLIEPTY